MAVCSVMLGLLPLALQFLLEQPHFGIKAAISFVEYGAAAVAAVSSLYRAYQLAYWRVCLVTTLAGTFGNTHETFAPLLWVVLPILIHIIGAVTIYIGRQKEPKVLDFQTTLQSCWSLKIFVYLRTQLIHEFTPSVFRTDVDPADHPLYKPKPKQRSKIRYWTFLLNYLIKLCVCFHAIYGTIVLSSILFLSLFDTIEVIGYYLGATVLCHLILGFEIYGMRVAWSLKAKKDGSALLRGTALESLRRPNLEQSDGISSTWSIKFQQSI
ncbi:hypothetical protein B0J11DRAFT_572277 [Dendryphion nanum]|uniref:Uncharacterized protein n=1 Tax=Dendryphion nanum TaxID=256645 RepID=A0A9P9D7X0_9PLEO|nr:hypothetical protein B0J11DRAFT_572277 [Dendryphion nanum]